jgi:hypothetical protein
MKLGQQLWIFALKITDKLPLYLQGITLRIINELRFLIFRLKLIKQSGKEILTPSRIYWISPERIVYHTNYVGNKSVETASFNDRVFGPEMRGKIVDGNWDITNYRFSDLDVFNAF